MGKLCERCEELPEKATLITPLANKRFHVTDVQEPRIIIIEDTDTGDSQPLHREQFEEATIQPLCSHWPLDCSVCE